METRLAPMAIACMATAILVFAAPAAFHWEQAPHALLGMPAGALTITPSTPGEHPFEVAVSDAHGEEWAPHILRIVPAAPAPPAE